MIQLEKLTLIEATIQDLDAIYAFQEEVVASIKDAQWFCPTSKEQYERMLSGSDLVLKVMDGERMAAFGSMVFAGLSDSNYASHLEVPKEDYGKWVNMDTIMVHPDYRGLGLQSYLFEQMEMRIPRNVKWAAGTVSPYNVFSYRNFEKCGYQEQKRMNLYGGMLRCIMTKEVNR